MNSLEAFLNNLEIPATLVSCRDVHCTNQAHREDIDDFTFRILRTVDTAAKPQQDTAIFWYNVWLSADNPRNTELHRIMKKTKYEYHHYVKKCKKAEEQIMKNKVLNSCIHGSSDVFNEIKKLRRHESTQVNSMDGATKENIPNNFKDVYKEL